MGELVNLVVCSKSKLRDVVQHRRRTLSADAAETLKFCVVVQLALGIALPIFQSVHCIPLTRK